MSSHYNTKIFQAMALADRILLRKKNCYLDGISDVRLDDSAFLPHIQQWTQLRTFRAAASDAQTKSRLETAVTQWLRSTHANDAPGAFVFCKENDHVAAYYGGSMDTEAIFRAQLDCDVHPCKSWFCRGYRYTGVLLGTLATGGGGAAETLAASSLGHSYFACVNVPLLDSEVQSLLANDRKLQSQLAPYSTYAHVYGNASRKTVEVPVDNVQAALEILKDEIAFFERASPAGLVLTTVRFGADDAADFLRLAGMLQANLLDERGQPGFEPTRLFPLASRADSEESCLAVPRVSVTNGDRFTAYTVSLQSTLSSASFCLPPVNSYAGYYVQNGSADENNRDLFPVVHPVAAADGIPIGQAVHTSDVTALPLSDLLCHTAIFGGTSTGKTTLIQQVLTRCWTQRHIPFVVLEAAKKEYHQLLGLIPELKVYTPGVDGMPLRFNPLQPEEGVLIENHVAAVTRAVTAATGAEHPIPEALAGLLQQTYERFGWRYGMLAYNDPAQPFPTFGDVLADIQPYIAKHAQYGPEVRQNLTGALRLRVQTMATGALGQLFSQPFGLTAKELLAYPTVIELADFSAESAAFLMNILLFKLQCHLERLPTSSVLQRLIVLEEAHNVFRRTLTEDSSLAHSNLALEKMFAEIRASGTGLILSDQRPSAMPDAVMANTSVKLCFALGSDEDRQEIGSAMTLSPLQRQALQAFQVGECILALRGHPGVCHVRTDKLDCSTDYTAACLMCSRRFRCEQTAVTQLLREKAPDRVQYHVTKIRANPYNPTVLVQNVQNLFRDLEVTSPAATQLCLLGMVLAEAGVPMQEARRMVRIYETQLKGA